MGPINKNIKQQLDNLYKSSIYILLSMYKNTSTEKQWMEVCRNNNDLECFETEYYERMKLFDIQSTSDSLLSDKKDGEIISWNVYIDDWIQETNKNFNDIITCWYGLVAGMLYVFVFSTPFSAA